MPSLCNVADLPSRDDFELLEEQGGRRTAMLFPPASDWTARWTFGTNGLETRPSERTAQ